MRLRQIGARLVERVLERPLVDSEQQVALLDELTILEVNFVEIARHPRAYLDRINGDEAPDIFVIIEYRALDRLGDGHGRRRRRAPLLLALPAACDQSCKHQRQCELSHAKHQRK